MDKDFEIIHLSFRRKMSGATHGGPVFYYIGNIVFRMRDGKKVFGLDLEKYEKVKVSLDLGLLKDYEDNLEFRFGEFDSKTDLTSLDIVNTKGIEFDDVFVEGYRNNSRPLHGFLSYNEKFDFFQLREYFQDTPVVRGIIQYLQDMKDGKPNPSRTAYSHQLISTLENLCWWWD